MVGPIGKIAPASSLAWLGSFLVLFGGSIPGNAAEPQVRFNRDVRAILSDKCFHCHGPDAKKREADLRLDEREAAIAAGAIDPGKPDQSAVIERISSDDPEIVMPPPSAKLGRLTPQEIQTLKRWIEQGAEYQSHWAFIPIEPPVLPEVRGEIPPRNPIDQLVFAGLAERGLKPQPEADRATLIRRVTFDLTGIAPSPTEVQAFVDDPDPRAYEKLIDRLLASQRFGERWAADWLDVARYADSYGFQVDRERDVWPWRDWVIRAFNENLPWDQFVTWQIAGDLLPNPTDDQLLATAFNRLHQQEAEGGSVEEEYRVNYVNDRVITFGTAFLGLTLECSRCHDHKFDPVTQKEFYQLFAFFDDIDEAGLYSYFTTTAPTPSMWLMDPAQKQRWNELQQSVETAETKLTSLRASQRPSFESWLKSQEGALDVPGELARFAFDDRDAAGKFANSIAADQPATSPPENTVGPGKTGQAVHLTGDHPVTTSLGNFHRYEPFTVSLWMKTPDLKERAVVFHRSRAWTDAASRGYELLIEDGRLKWSLIHFWPGDAISIKTSQAIPIDQWIHVAVTSDGSGRAAGLKLYMNGERAETEVVRDHLTKDITGGGGDTITIGERFRDRGFTGGWVDDFRVFGRQLAAVEVEETFEPGRLASHLAAAKSGVTADQDRIYECYLSRLDPASKEAWAAVTSARQQATQFADGMREMMVMRDLPQPKTAYILRRGEYNLRQDPVEPGTPEAMLPFPEDQPKNRLGLARWLTDPRHPLMARVSVNRFWQACFGMGLVKTAEDFGSQADPPQYPEVLDWLSSEFIRSGWNVKALLKSIVLSHTYRQKSLADAQVMADDPENLWLARGPRHRLPAEMIRDQLLSASGLLVEKIGGPPVRTYDLPESFKPAAAGEGDELYRRSLYTFWRRTGPAPVLEAFDVPKRAICIARRDTTNTALQALVLLNGPQFVEAARVLAEKLHAEKQGDPEKVLAEAFQRLTCRPPDPAERAILVKAFDEQRAWFSNHPEDADRYTAIGKRPRAAAVPVPELAALAAVINGVMNFDGCVVKR